MLLFNRAAIGSIICCGIPTQFDHLTVKLQNLIRKAGKIIGMLQPPSLQERGNSDAAEP